MLVINYNGNKPTSDYFKYSVQGNNQADIIRFVIDAKQEHINLTNDFRFYANIQGVDDDFVDKVELSNIENDGDVLTIDFYLQKKHTEHKQIEVCLSAETNRVCWKTQLVKITIYNSVNADDTIVNDYPTILQQLQREIDELDGGGGASDVMIDKIWVSFETTEMITKPVLPPHVVGNDNNNQLYTNGANLFTLHIKTTPISATMLNEIKDGRFVIRFNYPVKGRKRGFTNVLNADHVFERRLVFFITEEQVKTNAYGEQFVQLDISYLDFLNRVYQAGNGFYYDNHHYQLEFGLPLLKEMEDKYIDEFGSLENTDLGICGITHKPATATTRFHLTSGQVGFPMLERDKKFVVSPKNPKHDFFGVVLWEDGLVRQGNEIRVETRFTRLRGGNDERNHFLTYKVSTTRVFTPDESLSNVGLKDASTFERRRLRRITLQPSCAIIDENYRTLGGHDNCWLKSYSKSEQTITIGLNGVYGYSERDNNDCYFGIARCRISFKK